MPHASTWTGITITIIINNNFISPITIFLYGNTALLFAASGGHKECVEV
jgi:hypothetical protein